MIRDLQLDQLGFQSGLHWNCEPRSVELKVKRAIRELVDAGGEPVMRVFGGFLSTRARAVTLIVTVDGAPADPRAVPRYLKESRRLETGLGV